MHTSELVALESDFGSIYCPVCGCHAGKNFILAWHRLSERQQQSYCSACKCKGMARQPGLPARQRDEPLPFWAAVETVATTIRKRPASSARIAFWPNKGDRVRIFEIDGDELKICMSLVKAGAAPNQPMVRPADFQTAGKPVMLFRTTRSAR